MSTSLVHVGDFHAGPGPRNADRYRALDQIITEGLQLPRLGAWLWPGDLFDAASSTDDRNALDERLQRMASAAPVVICYGNHDRPGDLDGFARLKSAWPITVVDRPGCVRIRCATGVNATVFALPYPHKAGLAGAGVATGDVVSTAADLLEPIFMAAAAELADARAQGDLTLMIGHINVAGAVASTGQPNVGREIELNPKHLDRLGNIYKGLNHIHKPQQVAGAFYAGSVCRLGYGEIEDKQYLVVELQDDPDLISAVFSKPIDVAPMFHIEGRLTRTGFEWDHDDWMCLACNGTGDGPHHEGEGTVSCAFCDGSGRRSSWAGCDVRVRYRYQASEKSVLNDQLVRDLFNDALRLKVESVAIPDRDLRAPEVAAAKTLPEKLAAFFKVETLTPSMAEKLALLEQQDALQVLDAVTLALAAIEQPEKAQVAA